MKDIEKIDKKLIEIMRCVEKEDFYNADIKKQELLKMFESLLLMQQIEKDLILAGLYMVLSKTKKSIYKETNSSKDVVTIHNTITTIKNLIGKLED